MNRVRLAPSLMCADFVNLKPELDLFAETGTEFLHMDIMDGHYVPNFTLGPGFCAKIADYSPIPLDIHLMIEHVDSYIEAFARAKGTWLSFHPEAVYHPLRTLDFIRNSGAVPGIAIDPATPIEAVKHLLPAVDFVCVMTVNPGYSGQKLIPSMIGKIADLAAYAKEHDLSFAIEVDGNVSWEHIPKMVEAEADILVLGTSSLYDGKAPLETNIARIRDLTGG